MLVSLNAHTPRIRYFYLQVISVLPFVDFFVANGIISVSPTGAHSLLLICLTHSFTTAEVYKTFVFLNAESFCCNLSIIQREIALGEELCTVPTLAIMFQTVFLGRSSRLPVYKAS